MSDCIGSLSRRLRLDISCRYIVNSALSECYFVVHFPFDFSIVSNVCHVIHTSVGMPNTFSSCAAYAGVISLLPVHSALNVGGHIFASFAAAPVSSR